MKQNNFGTLGTQNVVVCSVFSQRVGILVSAVRLNTGDVNVLLYDSDSQLALSHEPLAKT